MISGKKGKFLCHRIVNRLAHFRDEGQICDADVVVDGKKYPVIKIQLAQACKWFERKFLEHQGEARPLIQAPENPDNSFQLFLGVIFTGKVNLTLEKLPSLIKMAEFYESENLIKIFRYFLMQEFTDNSVLLPVISNLVSLGLEEDAILLAPKLVPYFIDLINGSTTCPFTWEDMMKSVSPKVFVQIMNGVISAQSMNGGIPMNDDKRAELIQNFASYQKNGITEANDKEALASLIDWDDMMSYRYMNMYDCDWVPDRIARKCLSGVIDRKRRVINSMNKDVAKVQNNSVSRWFLFAWAQTVRDLTTMKRGVPRPQYKVIDFISTLGGNTSKFNPLPYGMMSGSTSGSCMAGYGIENLFDSTRYYMSIGNKVSLSLDICHGSVTLENVVIERNITAVKNGHCLVAHQPHVVSGAIKVIALDTKAKKQKASVMADVDQNEVDMSGVDDVNSITLAFVGTNSRGGTVMRLNSFDMLGMFNP